MLHYEGVDQRVADHLCDTNETSIGDYLAATNGARAALVVTDAMDLVDPGGVGRTRQCRGRGIVTDRGPLLLPR